MKFVLALALTLTAFNANAENTLLASCYGDHHGTYVDVFVQKNGKVALQTAYDGEVEIGSDSGTIYKIKSVTKPDEDAASHPSQAHAALIVSAIKENLEQKNYDVGLVLVKAVDKQRNTLVLNLNKFNGKNYLISNDVAEEMTCNLQ